MNRIQIFNSCIEKIEMHLSESMTLEDFSEWGYLSKHEFQRLFIALTDISLAEYIRNRKLTLAGEALAKGSQSVLETAFQFGYESPDAFTRAFKKFHGVLPSKIKTGQATLKAFPKLSIDVNVQGEKSVEYRICQKEATCFFGISFKTTLQDGRNFEEIPQFLQKIWDDGRHEVINKILGFEKRHMLHGVHYDFMEGGAQSYLMGWEIQNLAASQKYECVNIPEGKWIVFQETSTSEEPLAMRALWKRVYAEWMRSSNLKWKNGPFLEKFYWEDETCNAYRCEIWIPLSMGGGK